jgi:antirestriction protein
LIADKIKIPQERKMTARQIRQFYFLDMITSFGNGQELIDSEKELFRCVCDSCGQGASKSFKTCDDVRAWLTEHDGHETRIWFVGMPGIESEKEAAIDDQKNINNMLSKIEKLQKLAAGTSYAEEAESAIQKINELLNKFGID